MRRKQWRERKENKEGEKKNGGPRGCPPVRCGHKFSKRKKKNKRMKRTKKKQRSMFSMHLDFYKISLGHFQTRSKSLSRALLQFEHTNAQHTGIWWLPRPTFCQAAPFVIIPHWRLFTLIGVIMWSFGNLSAYKLPKLALVFLTLSFTLVGVSIWHLWWAGASETFIRNNPTVMTLLFTHSECSFETLNAYKVPTSCSLTHT